MIFILPCYVSLPRKTKADKKISLTMNWYRNAHFYESNTIKQLYNPTKGQVFTAKKIRVDYVLVLATNRRTDFSNWIGCAEKFFLDYLVKKGMIADDDWKHYSSNSSETIQDLSAKENYIIAKVTILENAE